ncbi:MAG: alpha/beta fold hydrolase [Candidatus Riflebacteria bacterium]|nr:alpha/beta fold hydrolase [Candidatus Riflebacteria bacterium]
MSEDLWQHLQQFTESAYRNVELGAILAERNARSLLAGDEPACQEDPYQGTTPFEVIYRFDRMRVLKFQGDPDERGLTPLLMIPSLINRSYVLDLMEGGSLVAHLTHNRHPTYLLDWGTPGPQHDHLSFGFYVDDLMSLATAAVRRDAGTDRLALLGYCMGGTMCLLHAALHPAAIDRITLLAAPVNFHDEGVLSKWAATPKFDVDRVVDTLHHMDSLMLQTSFLFLKPLSAWQKYKSLYEGAGNPKFTGSFVKLERWLNDNVSVPGELYREYVRICYQENRLVEGGLVLAGKPVDLKEITCPILNVIASKDHIVPIESSRIVSTLVGGPVREELIDAGHIGIAMGSKARLMFETVLRFHGEEASPPPAN